MSFIKFPFLVEVCWVYYNKIQDWFIAKWFQEAWEVRKIFYAYVYVLSQTRQNNEFSSTSNSSGSVWNETANSSSNKEVKKAINIPYHQIILSRLIFWSQLAKQKNGWWKGCLKTAILIFWIPSSRSMRVGIWMLWPIKPRIISGFLIIFTVDDCLFSNLAKYGIMKCYQKRFH